jgi:hypothetical protein
MSETQTETVQAQIDQRLAALASAEKQLKKPSSISFTERRDLTNKAAKAATELRALRADVADDAMDASEPVKTALDAADTAIGKIHDAWPANKGGGFSNNKLGQLRTGAAAGSQSRPPDRVGE